MNTPVSSRESLDALDALGARIDGHVSVPGQPGWDEARTAWNLAVDQRPVAVVVAGSVGDIVEAVRTAADLGLSVAAQATGHNAGPLAASDGLADTLLLRTSELRAVQVIPTCSSHASSPVRSGATSWPRSRRTDSPRSPDRRTTSACSVTPSVGA